MQAEQPKKRGRKSAADRVAEGVTVAVHALAPVEAEKPAEARQEAPAPAFVEAIKPAVMSLHDFIASKERADVPLVEVTHPEAEDGGFFSSRFSGIRLKKGECRVMYSDGTTE
jgi:hypothetical protein